MAAGCRHGRGFFVERVGKDKIGKYLVSSSYLIKDGQLTRNTKFRYPYKAYLKLQGNREAYKKGIIEKDIDMLFYFMRLSTEP